MARPAIGSIWRFRHPAGHANYGDLIVANVINVYPTVAHPGPAFTTYVYARTADGRAFRRALAYWNKSLRPAPASSPAPDPAAAPPGA